jgi:microcystin-dependent protein
MTTQFIGEVRLFGGSFAPLGWALCNGTVMSIAENQALFALIGATYGGDGTTTFALPDLRSRVAVGQGNGPTLSPRVIGEAAGQESVTLLASEMPAHMHTFTVSAALAADGGGAPAATLVPGAVSNDVGGHLFVIDDGKTPHPTPETLTSASCGPAGGGQGHDNLMPVLCITYIIALDGIFPQQQ